MRIVLDTNVLLVSLPSHSSFHAIYQAILQGHIRLYLTNDIVAEYEEKISQRLSIERTDIHFRELFNLSNVELINVYFNWYRIKADPDDNKFVDCAVACGADYLVTNDRHFNVLNESTDFPAVTIIKAEDFLTVLQSIQKP